MPRAAARRGVGRPHPTRAEVKAARLTIYPRCADIIQAAHRFTLDRETNRTSWTTTLLVGLSWWAESNDRILAGWRGNMSAPTKFWRAALHYTEEIGALDQWLPQAYAAAPKPPRRPPGGGGRGRRRMRAAA
jgi:hypothetical protein